MRDQDREQDHDQRLKTLIREFLREFFFLFFPLWAERFDFTCVEWLDKEVFLDPPQGEHRVADLVVKLGTRQELKGQRAGESDRLLALIHIEVESEDRAKRLRPRMPTFYEQLRQRHGLAVLPIAVYLRVALDGIGWDKYREFFWEHCILHFEYAYIGLPALDAETYVRGDNLLGVALSALMRVPEERRAWLRAEAERRILQSSETPAHQFLLHECVGAYLPLQAEQLREYEQLLGSEPFREVKPMALTMNETLMERRVAERVEEIKRDYERKDRETLQAALVARFSPLTAVVQQRLDALPAERLRDVLLQVVKGQSLQEMGLEP
jgi:hypothetical protein